jgi:hypothetical protein
MRRPIGFVARVHRRDSDGGAAITEAALGAGALWAFGLDEGGSLHALSKQRLAPQGEVMNELLELTVKAHGGLDRWCQVTSIRVPASITGAIWFVKGKGDVSLINSPNLFSCARLRPGKTPNRKMAASNRRWHV